MLELQQQLKENGIEPKAPQGAPQGYSVANALSSWGQQQQQQQPPISNWEPQLQPQPPQATSYLSPPTRPGNERQISQGILPEFRSGCIGDNYLGVSSENNWLSPIEGTSLALFGTKIDLSEYMPAETDSMTSAMSYRTFISHAFGRTQPFTPTMPPYEQCIVYAEWYFRTVQGFCPMLHKPHFMELLDRMFHQAYKPSSAEAVMVHMVLAIITFQFSARNHNEQARQDSLSHYQYALSFVPDLITGHKLEDIQALGLICSQLRNQPRPAAAWMFTNFVLGLAIESGLHRSAKAWQGSSPPPDAHHVEMRKRTFWTILLYHVALSGKLGRPMPLRWEDFDIEMPDLVADTIPRDGSSTQPTECSFSAAIEGFKICKIVMMIYSTIYSVKSNGQYEANVRKLDKELEEFQAQLPPQYQGGAQTRDDDRVNYLYIEMAIAECYLLIHHPSLCRSATPQIMQSNLDVCLDWSGRLLTAATQLKELKSLDTTWYSTTNFLAAIFTTLFAFNERRDQITSTELQKLRQDMDAWMEVIKEVSILLGRSDSSVYLNPKLTLHSTGTLPQLQVAVRQIIDFSLGNITRHLAAKTASAAVSAASSSPVDQQQQGLYGNGYNNGYGNAQASETHQQNYTQPTSYPNNPSYSFTEPQDNGLTYAGGNHFNASAGYGSDHGDVKPNIAAQLTAHNAQTNHMGQPDFMTPFTPALGNAFSTPPVTTAMNGNAGEFQSAGPAAWRYFADNMMLKMHHEQPHDYTGGLMALGGVSRADELSGSGMENIAATVGSMMHVPREYEQHAQVWPLIQFSGHMGH